VYQVGRETAVGGTIGKFIADGGREDHSPSEKDKPVDNHHFKFTNNKKNSSIIHLNQSSNNYEDSPGRQSNAPFIDEETPQKAKKITPDESGEEYDCNNPAIESYDLDAGKAAKKEYAKQTPADNDFEDIFNVEDSEGHKASKDQMAQDGNFN